MTAKTKTEIMFALVGQWKASGQTRQTFCAGQAINIHTFSYWATKYNQSQLSSPGGFAPIDLASGYFGDHCATCFGDVVPPVSEVIVPF